MNRSEIIKIMNNLTLENKEQEAIDYLCELLECEKKEEYMDLIYMLVDNFQLYGFVDKLDVNKLKKVLSKYEFECKLKSYSGKYINYFNNGQLSLIDVVNEKEKVIISAPTSFGKTSLLIEYIFQNSIHLNNIIFIVPTNSLVEELYIKFLKLNKKMEHPYIITVNNKRCVDRTIRILTPERFLVFYEYNNLENQDLIVMDETYKIEDNVDPKGETVENRALKFRKVLEVIGTFTKKVIMLSPYTYVKDDSMKKYMNKYHIIEENRNKKYVKHEYHNLTNVTAFKSFFNCKITSDQYSNINEKVIQIMKMLREEKNIIYINTPSKAIELIKKFKENDSLVEEIRDERYIAFLNHLEELYAVDSISEWYIITALKLGIGIYVSSVPRYIKREIVRLYDTGIIKNLIVTTAFVEGVNSVAKNIIITSGCTGGTVRLNEMSLLNIAGRAGRFGSNYIGHVFFIDKDTYEKTNEAQKNGVVLANPNYRINTSENLRNDYEIEMIEDEYLNYDEIIRKNEIKMFTNENGLNYEELKRVCISMPTAWKVKIYNYFESNTDNIETYKEYVENVLVPENEKVVEGITRIFDVLKEIEIPIYHSFGEMKSHSRDGEFLWGKFYKQHQSGLKQLLVSKKIYILSEKARLTKKFFENSWIKKYFDSQGEFNDNKLYEETFKFISSIIEFKIPYYVGLFIGMYKYYIEKNNIVFDDMLIDLDEAYSKLENLGVEERLQHLYDYGFPKEMIEKMSRIEKNIKEYTNEELIVFDEYEKIMIEDYLKIVN